MGGTSYIYIGLIGKSRSDLKDAIVFSGVFQWVWQEGYISATDVKNNLTSSSRNYTDEIKAEMLIVGIIQSL